VANLDGPELADFAQRSHSISSTNETVKTRLGAASTNATTVAD
jgi:hypothetical protein